MVALLTFLLWVALDFIHKSWLPGNCEAGQLGKYRGTHPVQEPSEWCLASHQANVMRELWPWLAPVLIFVSGFFTCIQGRLPRKLTPQISCWRASVGQSATRSVGINFRILRPNLFEVGMIDPRCQVKTHDASGGPFNSGWEDWSLSNWISLALILTHFTCSIGFEIWSFCSIVSILSITLPPQNMHVLTDAGPVWYSTHLCLPVLLPMTSLLGLVRPIAMEIGNLALCSLLRKWAWNFESRSSSAFWRKLFLRQEDQCILFTHWRSQLLFRFGGSCADAHYHGRLNFCYVTWQWFISWLHGLTMMFQSTEQWSRPWLVACFIQVYCNSLWQKTLMM